MFQIRLPSIWALITSKKLLFQILYEILLNTICLCSPLRIRFPHIHHTYAPFKYSIKINPSWVLKSLPHQKVSTTSTKFFVPLSRYAMITKNLNHNKEHNHTKQWYMKNEAYRQILSSKYSMYTHFNFHEAANSKKE